jgi:hypothetical protein
VCLLVDAVRSRDDTQLELLLQNCIQGVHGTNDRHPVTERCAQLLLLQWHNQLYGNVVC